MQALLGGANSVGNSHLLAHAHTCDSTSSNAFECRSHSAAFRMSASLMQPLLLLYAKMLQWEGWNSAEVMTCGLA